MKTNMNLSLSYSSPDSPIDSFLRFLEQLLNDLKESENNFSDNVSYCLQLRKDRRKFCSELVQLNAKFSSLSETKQRDIELHLYNAINEIEKLFPSVKDELKEDVSIMFRLFLVREIRKTLKMFKKHQKEMQKHLYPDRRKEILSNPDLYQSLVDAWGDLADDEN